MTREECEQKIVVLLSKVNDVYREYSPEGQYLNLMVDKDYIHGFNNPHREDTKKPIDFCAERKEGEKSWALTTFPVQGG